MASAIENIYGTDGLATWTPQYDTDVSVNVLDLHQIKAPIKRGDCPTRMLTVTGSETGAEFAWIAMGKLNKVTWVITDRLFLSAAEAGRGIQEWSENIIKYISSYIDQVRDNRSPTAQSHVIGVTFEPQVFEWPGGSDEWWAGVDCIVEIEEVLSGA